MTLEQFKMWSAPNFLNYLQPPAHVILLYGDFLELDDITSNIMVKAYEPSATLHLDADQNNSGPSTQNGAVNSWVIYRVESDALSNLERLIGFERRIRDAHQPPMALCAYPLKLVIELDMSVFVDILSLHDYILFPRFIKGQMMVLEAVEEVLMSVFGRSGSEIIYHFTQQMGIERGKLPIKLRRFRHVLRKLLGFGAEFLERLVFQRLYFKLRSYPEVVCEDG